MFADIADRLVENGIVVIKFDFNGHGNSDGDFSVMNVYSEIFDAAKIFDDARSLDWVKKLI